MITHPYIDNENIYEDLSMAEVVPVEEYEHMVEQEILRDREMCEVLEQIASLRDEEDYDDERKAGDWEDEEDWH